MPEYLSRFIMCSRCDQYKAEYTVLDENNKALEYLCETCAEFMKSRLNIVCEEDSKFCDNESCGLPGPHTVEDCKGIIK